MEAFKRVEIQIAPGTTPVPDSTNLEAISYVQTDKVQFYRNKMENIPFWMALNTFGNGQTLEGAARTIFSYFVGKPRWLIGTNTRLYVYTDANLYNITPFSASDVAIPDSLDSYYETLATDPLTMVNGSTTVTITQTLTKVMPGDSVEISGVSGAVHGIPDTDLNGVHFVQSMPTANSFTIVVNTAATSSGVGGGASVNVATGIITVNDNAHGLSDGDRVSIQDAATFAGLADTAINIEHIIRNVTANTFDIVVNDFATSSASAGGGVSTIYFPPIAAGAQDVEAANGFGGGDFGEGAYGTGGTFSGVYNYPRVWSFGLFGNDVVMTPGGGTNVYIWQNDVEEAPTILANAPTQVNWVFVTNQAVGTLGASGVGNRIKLSDIGDATVWDIDASTNAYADDIEGYGTFISQAISRGTNLIFTNSQVILFSYIGYPDLYTAQPLMNSSGIIGPNARCQIDDNVFWMDSNYDIYVFNGGTVSKVPGNTCEKFLQDNMNPTQAYKTVAWPRPDRKQVWFIWPDLTSNEPNVTLCLNYEEGHFTLGTMLRTGVEQPSPLTLTPVTTYSLEDESGYIYLHETGSTYENEPNDEPYGISNYAQIGEGDENMQINYIYPDSTQTGNVDMTINYKYYSQSEETFTANLGTITPSTSFLDCVITGRQRQYEVRGTPTTNFRIGKWFEAVQKGTPI